MRIYYDTEFLDNGTTIELISIGMVAEDGRSYYAINKDLNLYRVMAEPWLRQHVMRKLPVTTYNQVMIGQDGRKVDGYDWNPAHAEYNFLASKPAIRLDVKRFVLGTPLPELWAWYGAYDHVALCQLFGKMIDLPSGFPRWTNELRQETQRLGNPQLPSQKTPEHHALNDAVWTKEAHEWLLTRQNSSDTTGM